MLRCIPLAAFARLYNHVRKLFNFGVFAKVIQDGKGFKILGYTAWRCRCFWIDGIIQAEDLEEKKHEMNIFLLQQIFHMSHHCLWVPFVTSLCKNVKNPNESDQRSISSPKFSLALGSLKYLQEAYKNQLLILLIQCPKRHSFLVHLQHYSYTDLFE